MTDPHDQQPAPGSYYGPPPTDRNYNAPSLPPYGAYPPYGYPQYPGYAGYPAYPAYPGYPVPPPPPPNRGPQRPGLVTAATVLGWVNAGVLVLAGMLLLWGAAIVRDIDHSRYFTTEADATELLLLAIGNLVAGGLLIAGGVMFAGGRRRGRVMLTVANGVVVGLFCYWLARSGDDDSGWSGWDGWLVWGIFFGLVALLSAAFSFTATINGWLAGKDSLAEPLRRLQ